MLENMSRRDASEAESTGPAHGTSPYTRPSTDDDATFAFSAMDVEDLDSSALPPGWKFEDGYIVLTEQPKDYWGGQVRMPDSAPCDSSTDSI